MSLSANEPTQPRIFVLHENTAWVEPLRREFATIDAPFCEWFLDRGLVDLTSAPPEGIFYNRMSASSHTRGHRYAPEYTAAVLAWLTKHRRTIVNGERALQLEVSKVAQYESWPASVSRPLQPLPLLGANTFRALPRPSAIRSFLSTTVPERVLASS